MKQVICASYWSVIQETDLCIVKQLQLRKKDEFELFCKISIKFSPFSYNPTSGKSIKYKKFSCKIKDKMVKEDIKYKDNEL